MKSRKLIILAMLGALSIGVLTACGSAEKAPAAGEPKQENKFDGTIKFGVIAPMSGAAASWGISLLGSVELAVEDANNKGGVVVNGKRYNFSVDAQNSEYKGPKAVQSFEKLNNDGVKIIFGPIGAQELTAIQPLTTKQKALMLSDSYSVKAIAPEFPLNFHASQGPLAWAESMVSQLKKVWPDVKTVAVLGPNDQAGWDVANSDIKAYEKGAFTEITKNYYERETTDFGPLLTKALATKPDVLELGAAPSSDAGNIIKQARKMGFKGVISKGGGPGIQEVTNVAGEENLQNFIYYSVADLDSQEYKDFAKRFKDKKGQDLQEIGLDFNIAASIVIDGINKTQSSDPENIAKAIRTDSEFPVKFFEKAWWGGQSLYGVNQELNHPYYLGIYKDGKKQPFYKVTFNK